MSRMKDLAIDCYLSCKQMLNPNKRRNSFELFGFDFMIDEDFRTWLIEVNTNPSLALNNKGMKHILPKMFTDLFTIVLDPVFERMSSEEKDEIADNTNFDLLWSRTRCINKRRPVKEGIYPVKELDPRAPRNFHVRRNHRKAVASIGDARHLVEAAITTPAIVQPGKSTALEPINNDTGIASASRRKESMAQLKLPECPQQPNIAQQSQVSRPTISRHGSKRTSSISGEAAKLLTQQYN